MNKVIVLDRDGVINVDLMTYVTKPEDFEFIEGSIEAISLLQNSGFTIAIATNQACIEKKIIDDRQLKAVHDFMNLKLAVHGPTIDCIAYCPHDPDSKCACRKPEVGLLVEIEKELGVSLEGSFFVGDKETDIMAANNYNCVPLLVKTGYGMQTLSSANCPPANHCFENLFNASKFIVSTIEN